MSIDPQKVRSLFLQAVERCEPGQWDSFLETACGDDLPLRDRVAAMLAAHLGEDSVLDVEANLYAPTIDRSPECVPGDQLGPYKLLQPIGEGGMGSVWMAEQHEPVRRRVALKLIKPGMDSRQVLARFEAERQALSMMDHPNIAKVFDAGTIGDGGKGVRSHLCEAPAGPFRQMTPDPFSAPLARPCSRLRSSMRPICDWSNHRAAHGKAAHIFLVQPQKPFAGS